METKITIKTKDSLGTFDLGDGLEMGTKVNLGREDIQRNVLLAKSWSDQTYEVRIRRPGKGV